MNQSQRESIKQPSELRQVELRYVHEKELVKAYPSLESKCLWTLCPKTGHFCEQDMRNTENGITDHFLSAHRIDLPEKQPINLTCRWSGCREPGPYFTRRTFLNHIRHSHLKLNTFKCHLCQGHFEGWTTVKEHVRTWHPDYILLVL
ncbi:hypothetical protein CPB84DRAFT_1783823, partial [Gymnopilus junonius]